MKKQIVIILYLFFCLSIFGSEQDDLDKILETYIPDGEPGAVLCVFKDGKPIYRGARGLASIETKEKLTPDHQFYIASVTKQFTAAAIMILNEEGELYIGDNISNYLPDYPTYGHQITIRQLLTHTSGLSNLPKTKEQQRNLGKNSTTLDMTLDVLSSEQMLFMPGDKYSYSNTGYLLLGKIIEVASGENYADFMTKRIFQKLGMKNTYFADGQADEKLASGHYYYKNHFVFDTVSSTTWMHTAAGLISTADDLAIWQQALINHSVIANESYEQMIAPVTLNNGEKSDYCFGFIRDRINQYERIWHFGLLGGSNSNSVYFPNERIHIVVLTNLRSRHPHQITNAAVAKLFSIHLPEYTPVKLSITKLRNLEGSYQTSEGYLKVLTVEKGVIHIQRNGGRKLTLTQVSDTCFYVEGSISYFSIEEDNQGRTIMKAYHNLSSEAEIAVKL